MRKKDKIKITKISVKVPGIEIPRDQLDAFRRTIRNAARKYSKSTDVGILLCYTSSDK